MNFIFDPSLALYLPLYQLDGGSFKSKDAYGHLCTVTGALWRPDGRLFDGDDVIYTSNPSFVDDQSGTLLFWMKCAANDTRYVPVSASVDGASDDEFIIVYQAAGGDGKIGVALNINGAASWTAYSAENTITDTNWHLISVKSNGSTTSLSVDTATKTLTDADGTNSGQWFGDATDADVFSLGGLKRAALTLPFSGTIGEAWICSRALTPQEIQNIYLATKWRYR